VQHWVRCFTPVHNTKRCRRWCMPVSSALPLLALFQLFNLHVSVCCVVICTVCAAYIPYTFHTMSYVMSVMLPCSSLILEPDVGHMNVKPDCMLQCIYVHKSIHALGTCHYCPRRYRVCDLFVLVKLQAAFSLFTQTEDSSPYRQPTRAASARRSRACLPCAWLCGQVPACA